MFLSPINVPLSLSLFLPLKSINNFTNYTIMTVIFSRRLERITSKLKKKMSSAGLRNRPGGYPKSQHGRRRKPLWLGDKQ